MDTAPSDPTQRADHQPVDVWAVPTPGTTDPDAAASASAGPGSDRPVHRSRLDRPASVNAIFAILVIAGGGLLGYLAGEIAIEDVGVKGWIAANLPQLHYIAPIAGILVVVGVGVWKKRRQAKAAP